MKTLKERIAVEQACLDGKIIDCYPKSASGSHQLGPDVEGIVFNWGRDDYCITEEPLEFWVNDCKHKMSELFDTEESALADTCSSHAKTIKVREVTE